jgi:DNA-binding PadR family transcriptional regulator
MTPKERSAKSSQPLSPAMFYVLLALADGEKHGYAVMKEVSLRTAGRVRLSAGTLYGIIKRLLNEGAIEECRERPAAEDDDERRRYYRLTTGGRKLAVAEAERMDEALAVARVKKLLGRQQPA